MTQELSEGTVARLLLVLGVAVFAGLLPVPWIDTAVAIGLLFVGLVLAVARPRGNRVLGLGIAALGLMLLVAGLLETVIILNALTVFVAAILLVAAWLKYQGKW
ncbi:MAG: hypothetical protein AABY18_09590 [Candidatus Thermoplasmatota archaeon]